MLTVPGARSTGHVGLLILEPRRGLCWPWPVCDLCLPSSLAADSSFLWQPEGSAFHDPPAPVCQVRLGLAPVTSGSSSPAQAYFYPAAPVIGGLAGPRCMSGSWGDGAAADRLLWQKEENPTKCALALSFCD